MIHWCRTTQRDNFRNNSEHRGALVPIVRAMRSEDGIADSWQGYDQGASIASQIVARKEVAFKFLPKAGDRLKRSL